MKIIAPNTSIRVAVIGLGRSGWTIHLRALIKRPSFVVVAAVDPLPERREEAAKEFGITCYSTLGEMLGKESLDLVIVASPSFCHYDDALAVLRTGCHCILEKPMAPTLKDARFLAAEAEKCSRRLFVYHNHIFLPPYNHFREVIASGILGPLFSIRMFMASYTRRWDWQVLKKNGGGYLRNYGSHALSIALPLLDSPVTRVECNAQLIKDAGDTEDHVDLLLKTESGRTANITVTTCAALPGPTYTLFGKYGTLTSDGKTSRLKYFDGDALPLPSVIDAAAPERKYQKEDLPWTEETRECKPSGTTIGFYENVAAVLRGEADPIVTVTSALEVLRVLELAAADAMK